MPRLGTDRSTALALLLGTALLGFGLVADRGLDGQARTARQAALSGVDEEARLTALSARAALAQVEQEVAAGRLPAGGRVERLASPPPPGALGGSSLAYGTRSRAELAKLLTSTGVTANGLPEAVVARVALGKSGETGDDVAERLLSGRLPVKPEDVAFLARALGVGDDPRVVSLPERLRRAPDVHSLPRVPHFLRTRLPPDRIEGWALDGAERLRYEVGLADVLVRAGLAGRARAASARGARAASPWERVVPFPEVDGLALTVAVEPPGALRLVGLRVALWLLVLASGLLLFAAWRAVQREARAQAAERRFLFGVTHELRTPLSAIRLLGETLADGRGDARDYGTLIARESERLDAFVERVLAVTRIDEAMRFTPVEPAAIVASALELIAPRAARRSVALRGPGGGAPLESLWDREAVRSALLNLLDNAVVHGREGGCVAVSLSGDERTVEIRVEDDGPGIARRDRGRIFQRFARGATEAPGTGLGLYLVEQVALAHGGRVDFRSEEGKGASFALVLPRRPSGAAG